MRRGESNEKSCSSNFNDCSWIYRIYLGEILNLEGYLGIVFAIAVMGYFVMDAIEKK